MLNSCDFQGRLAADPELRTTQTGKQVASFRMAVDRDMVDANGHRPTDWLTFTAWKKDNIKTPGDFEAWEAQRKPSTGQQPKRSAAEDYDEIFRELLGGSA